jgi:hypothetical protein
VRLTRFVPLYATLLLALAALGVLNQARFERQAWLIDRKAELHAEIGELRSEAALVRGPLAVGAWARAQGMVPAPEVAQVRHAAAVPAPPTDTAESGLEMRTVWR